MWVHGDEMEVLAALFERFLLGLLFRLFRSLSIGYRGTAVCMWLLMMNVGYGLPF